MIVIYTDGSTRHNGHEDATGGFGVVVCEGKPNSDPKTYKVIAAHSERGEVGTTNNREELKAIIWAIQNYGAEPGDFFSPIVYSDSMYCVNIFTDWIKRWKRNNWRRSGNLEIENLDLVQLYDTIINNGRQIDLRWIKGHKDENIWNDVADGLATGRLTPEEVMEQYG